MSSKNKGLDRRSVDFPPGTKPVDEVLVSSGSVQSVSLLRLLATHGFEEGRGAGADYGQQQRRGGGGGGTESTGLQFVSDDLVVDASDKDEEDGATKRSVAVNKIGANASKSKSVRLSALDLSASNKDGIAATRSRGDLALAPPHPPTPSFSSSSSPHRLSEVPTEKSKYINQ